MQLAVVRELALDQPGGQPRAADLERRVALAEAQRELAAAPSRRCSSFERPAGHQHLLAAAPALRRRAGRARPAGTSRWPPGAGRRPRRSSSTPVRTARASSVLAARTTWRSASANGAAGSVTRLGGRLGQPRVVVEPQRPDRELRPSGADADVVVGRRLDLDRAGRAATARCRRRGGPARRPRRRCSPPTVTVEPDRQLEVGAGDRAARRP